MIKCCRTATTMRQNVLAIFLHNPFTDTVVICLSHCNLYFCFKAIHFRTYLWSVSIFIGSFLLPILLPLVVISERWQMAWKQCQYWSSSSLGKCYSLRQDSPCLHTSANTCSISFCRSLKGKVANVHGVNSNSWMDSCGAKQGLLVATAKHCLH